MPLVPLVTGVFGLAKENPIMGPPAMIRAAVLRSPPQYSIKAPMGVPMGTSKFFGRTIPPPVTLMTRWVNGILRMPPRATDVTVATLDIATPMSEGSPPKGTSRLSTALIRCFSLPCGYLPDFSHLLTNTSIRYRSW